MTLSGAASPETSSRKKPSAGYLLRPCLLEGCPPCIGIEMPSQIAYTCVLQKKSTTVRHQHDRGAFLIPSATRGQASFSRAVFMALGLQVCDVRGHRSFGSHRENLFSTMAFFVSNFWDRTDGHSQVQKVWKHILRTPSVRSRLFKWSRCLVPGCLHR